MTARLLSLHAAGQGFVKDSAPELVLLAHHGAEGDRHAGRDPARALLLTPEATYAHLAARGLELPYGSLGENLVVSGLNPHDLPEGARLEIAEAVLELWAPCPVCRGLSEIDLRLPKLIYGRRGVYARVLRGGLVAVGDEVVANIPALAG